MLFYKIQGIDPEMLCEESDFHLTQNERKHAIRVKSDEFNERNRKNAYCFFSTAGESLVNVCMITTCTDHVMSYAQKYLNYIGVHLKDVVVCEITFHSFRSLLGTAYRQDYVEDDDDVLEKFGLDKLEGRLSVSFGENMIEARSREELIEAANKYLMSETLIPEIDRISAGKTNGKVSGHPVHYMVETDDNDARREMCRVLLGALYAGKRLESRRYTYIDLGGRDDGAPYMSYEALYRSCGGGAIIARYRANDDREDEEAATGEFQQIETLCDVAKNHRNDVLTIVCLPRECTGLKERFYDCFGNIAMVELREDFVDRAGAEAYLRGVAKEHHIRADKQLFRNLEDNKCYLAAELKVLFDEWYNHKLKHTIYPQYKDLNAVGEKVVRAKPRGSAYDELREMIGLKEAKQVIDKALNYYKVQKLYRDKGLKQEKASMHMIFTGNPGTAKTTVARLFARIMRENGLLSKGHLVEVGRGDLVGRYVGWTAKTVQSKFKEAMGGVLFIDEAYSLVDGHSGSFGDEAINTIVQEMENHREDLIVIFAGYPDKMEEFLQKNPGLRSRIAFHIPFSDYDTEELCKIAQLIVRNRGMNIDEAAMTKLGLVFEQARLQHDFGNGRYVRNVFEQAKMNQASRLLKLDFEEITAQDLSTIKAEDIVLPPSSPKPMQKRRIGFY